MIRQDFYNKTIFMLSLILGLIFLDAFIPSDFYNNFINNTRVFRFLSILVTLSGLVGTILVKLEDKNKKG